MTRLIMFLVRKKLRLKNGECFRFSNQKNKADEYYIDSFGIWKLYTRGVTTRVKMSNVSLNWLLNPCCEIEKV